MTKKFVCRKTKKTFCSINPLINQSITPNSNYAKPIWSPPIITILNLNETQTGPVNATESDATSIWS